MFIDVGQRLGVDGYYKYFTQFGLKGKTGIDLPGEAATIMHKKENMGLVELATVSFGQSFQITPVQLITTAASIVNGGNRVTPHFGVETVSADGTSVHKLDYPSGGRILSEETSATMRYVLEQVVSEGSGKKAKLEGYRVRQPPRKSFQEALKNIFHRLSALHRLTIRRLWPSLPLMSRRGFITAEP